MSRLDLSPEKDFLVKEEKWVNFVMAILFLALFVYGLTDAAMSGFRHIDYQSILFTLALAPAWIFFRQGLSKRIHIRVNRTGIYQDEKLVTAWTGFVNARLDQQQKLASIKDNFVLVVEYRRGDPVKGFRRIIPLTNTQNQSEEDVLKAVQFFWIDYQKRQGRTPGTGLG